MYNKRTLRKALLILAMLPGIIGTTYAYKDYTQHKSNEFDGKGMLYDARLVENFTETPDWKISDGQITKQISAANMGTPPEYGPVYVRLQLKEYMEISAQTFIYSDKRYMTDTDGKYIVFPTQAEALAAYPGHNTAQMTDYVTGVTGWFIETKPHDDNGEYGKFVATGEKTDAPVPVIPGTVRATDTVSGFNMAVTQECSYPVHRWDGNNLQTADYVQWQLGAPQSPSDPPPVIKLSEWNGKPGPFWILDDSSQYASSGWAYWGEPLNPESSTSDLLKSVSLIKQPDGSFYYVVHADMQAVSLDDLSQWTDMPGEIKDAYTGSTCFISGDGTAANPYIITTAAQLACLADAVNSNRPDAVNGGYYAEKCYMLGNDIDLSAYGKGAAFNDGKGWMPIGTYADPFKGSFDGDNKKITGLYINDDNLDIAGLFGTLSNGTVQNLGIADADITGNSAGGVVSDATESNLTNCYFTGTVSSSGLVGGVVGSAAGGNITNCYSMGSVSGGGNVGGVVGLLFSDVNHYPPPLGTNTSIDDTTNGTYGNLSDCYSTSAVSGGNCVGGVIGCIYGGVVANCYAAGAVSGADNVGGVAGYIDSDIDVTGVKNCAALNPRVTAAYGGSAGRVTGTYHYVYLQYVLINNTAFSGMLNSAGTIDWANIGSNSPDGANLTADTIIAANFWKTTTSDWNAWSSTWITTEGKLPILAGLFGQDGAMPSYIAENR